LPKEMGKPYWASFPVGDNPPEIFNAIIEIPKGSRVKYEIDKLSPSPLVKVDRILRFPGGYPANYGFIPSTYDEDKDPIDVIILCDEPIQPLTLVVCKPIGLLNTIDTGERDDKVLAVITTDPMYGGVTPERLNLVYAERYEELKYFFEHYKEREPNRWIKVKGWESAENAKKKILHGIELFKREFRGIRRV